MNESLCNTPPAGADGRKALALLAAVGIIGVSLYLAREPLPDAPFASAGDSKDKKETPTARRRFRCQFVPRCRSTTSSGRRRHSTSPATRSPTGPTCRSPSSRGTASGSAT